MQVLEHEQYGLHLRLAQNEPLERVERVLATLRRRLLQEGVIKR
jgi:hypothetical protein